MNAVIFRRHGGPEVLEWMSDHPVPVPGPGEALVEVRACSVNHLDLWTRMGMPGVTIPLPHVLGCDVAGVVAQLGGPEPSPSWFVGQPVVAAPGLSCGQCAMCRAGRDMLCDRYQILGFQVDGGYAQFVNVPVRNLIPVTTDRLDFSQWAAVPLVFLTAWHMLITRGKLQRGETVLIHAAGSGIGSAAIQVAKRHGALVITTVGSAGKVSKAKALGADHVINYAAEDFSKVVLRITNDRGVDLVFEHIGPATWAGSVRCMAKGGRLVTCGATTGREVGLDLRYLFAKELSIAGCYMGGRRELDEVLGLIRTGDLRPVVSEVFPLQEAAKAHETMEARQHFGKLVLVP